MNRWRTHLPVLAALVAAPLFALGVTPDHVGVDDTYQRWYSSDPLLAAAERQLYAHRDSLITLQRNWELLDSREKATAVVARGAALEIQADRDVPSATVRRFTDAARAEMARLTAEPAYPVVLRISLDPMSAANYRRATMLPQRADAPCVAMVRLGTQRATTTGPYEFDQLLGTCGLFAKFGAPGAGMDRWLTRTRLRTSPGHTGPAQAPRKRVALNTASIDNAIVPMGCLVGRAAACDDLFDDGVRNWTRDWSGATSRRPEPTEVARVAIFGVQAAAQDPSVQLRGLRASLGDDRFAPIWRSESEPAEAFELNEGMPLATWVRSQLQAGVEPYRAGPMIARVPFVLAVALAGLLTWVALRFTKREFRG